MGVNLSAEMPPPSQAEQLSRYRHLATMSAEWYWEQDSDLRFVWVEDVQTIRPVVPASAFLGKRRWEVDGQILTEAQWAPHRAVLAAHQPFRDFEYPLYRADRRLAWVAISGDPLFDAEGRFKGYRGIGREVTRRHDAEDALQISEARLRLAFAASREGLWDWDVRSGEVFYSEGWKSMLGYAGDEIEPKITAWHRLLHPDDHDRAIARVGDLGTGAGGFEQEFRLRHKAGHYLHILSHAMPISEYPGGPVTRLVGTHVDLTDRKRVENRLLDLLQFNQAVLDAVPAQICALDADGNILATNAAWRRLSIQGGQTVTGTGVGSNYFAVADAVTGEDAPAAQTVLRGLRAVATGSVSEFSTDYRCAGSGQTFWYRLRASHVAGTGAVKAVVVHHDITEQTLAHNALSRSLQEKVTLLREMQHRVKNNLQVLSSLLHFHAARMRDSVDRQVLEDGQARLRAMMLLHERLYGSPDLLAADLGDYARSLLSQLHVTHEGASRRIECRSNVQAVLVPMQLAMPCGLLIGELVSNSLKHAFPSPRGGCITLDVHCQGATLIISVADDGVGLGDSSAPATHGFGLRLVDKLADQLGATVTRESRGGLRTEVSIPMPEKGALSGPAQELT